VSLKNYFVHQAVTVTDAENELQKIHYDLLLIDVTLPDGNGFDLCLRLCNNLVYENIPKILLTANGDVADKVYGFTCGANDYVTKPFHLQELKARVDRYLQRQSEIPEQSLSYACFSFETSFQKCYLIDQHGKQDLQLTPTEFRLLLTLVRSEGEVLTRNFLERAAWGPKGTTIQVRGIDTHINHLRKKLGSLGHIIEAVYGQGYCLRYSNTDQSAA
jgi:DNA-binding response OmpR family regulator